MVLLEPATGMVAVGRPFADVVVVGAVEVEEDADVYATVEAIVAVVSDKTVVLIMEDVVKLPVEAILVLAGVAAEPTEVCACRTVALAESGA